MKEWMIKTATILFDDSKNDLRALPKTVRLQLLTTLSFLPKIAGPDVLVTCSPLLDIYSTREPGPILLNSNPI